MCLARVDDNEIAIAAKGGLDVLLVVMQTHKASAAVMEPACAALWNLAANGKPPSLCVPVLVETGGRRETWNRGSIVSPCTSL